MCLDLLLYGGKEIATVVGLVLIRIAVYKGMGVEKTSEEVREECKY